AASAALSSPFALMAFPSWRPCSVLQGNGQAYAALDGLLERQGCGRHVLQGRPCRVEDRDLVWRLAAWLSSRDQVGQLRVDGVARHRACLEGVVQVADARALLQHIGHDNRCRHQLRIQLLLVLAIGPYRGDEGAGPNVLLEQERLSRRRAGDTGAATSERGGK